MRTSVSPRPVVSEDAEYPGAYCACMVPNPAEPHGTEILYEGVSPVKNP